jgi:PAS domain S-box-containing protein
MKYRFSELIDIDKTQALTDGFCGVAGIASAIIDLDGIVLIGSRWQRICTDFHRVNPRALHRCIESDTRLANKLLKGNKYAIYKCRNGLTDAATPIVIEGKHVANFFIGQFLTEPPDIDYFRKQAREFGFDETSYIEALSKVPIIPKERVEPILVFFSGFAEFLGEMGLRQIRQLKATDALRDRERQLAQIIEGTSIPIFVIDKQHTVTYWNRACENLTRVSATEMLGTRKQWSAFYPEERPVMADLVINESAEGEIAKYYRGKYQKSPVIEEAYEAEVFFHDLGKNGKWLFFTAAPLKDHYGKVIGAIETLQDITDRKRAEKKLKRTITDLERSNAELQQFAYVASHDLQEPLRMVSSYVQLLKRRYKGKLDSDADDFIAFAVDGALRMQTLINDLLTYSRVGTRGKPFEPTDCEAVLEQVLANLKLAIEESRAVITLDALPTVMADSSQLVQLIQNLIDNAIKFRGKDTPRIHISATRGSGIRGRRSEVRGQKSEIANRSPQTTNHKAWIFSVRDNGIGIDPEFFDRIFTIFQRLHNRVAVYKKIVECHRENEQESYTDILNS